MSHVSTTKHYGRTNVPTASFSHDFVVDFLLYSTSHTNTRTLYRHNTQHGWEGPSALVKCHHVHVISCRVKPTQVPLPRALSCAKILDTFWRSEYMKCSRIFFRIAAHVCWHVMRAMPVDPSMWALPHLWQQKRSIMATFAFSSSCVDLKSLLDTHFQHAGTDCESMASRS